jgi:hypothetical protein
MVDKEKDSLMNSAINLLVSDSHGVYVPQAFREKFDLALWDGIRDNEIEAIEAGPDHEWYWEAWNDILNSATYTQDGDTYRLWQDGDLWAICYERMTVAEYEEFFGEKHD